jgi:hypothetical protein
MVDGSKPISYNRSVRKKIPALALNISRTIQRRGILARECGVRLRTDPPPTSRQNELVISIVYSRRTAVTPSKPYFQCIRHPVAFVRKPTLLVVGTRPFPEIGLEFGTTLIKGYRMSESFDEP